MMRLGSLLRRLWHAAFAVEIWNIGVVHVDAAELVAGGRLGPVRWGRIRPHLRLRADPSLWQAPDGLRILYEELPFYGGKAGIYSIAIDEIDQDRCGRLEIDRRFHLSYPQVIEEQGITYCMPEAACANGVDLYPWDPARAAWGEPVRVLDGIAVIDPTVVRHSGKWFLFGTLRGDTVDSHLWIWHAESLLGPWAVHASAPIMSVSRTARGAGPFFVAGGALYRPSQAGHKGYGCELCLNRVEYLSPDEYKESEVLRLLPDPSGPYPNGLHTLVMRGNVAVIDGKCYAWHPLAAISKLIWRLRSG
ncbi:MAG: hypothetical protein ABL964_01285 [Steroidobacteraceae bacterium]